MITRIIVASIILFYPMMILGNIYWIKYTCSPSRLFKWTYLFVNFNRRLVSLTSCIDTNYSKFNFKCLFIIKKRTPALSVQSVCLSISSMLSSCREKKRPADNTLYVKTCNKNPKKTKWWYHGMYCCEAIKIKISKKQMLFLPDDSV